MGRRNSLVVLDASGPEVSPLVSHGRLDTGTSALEGTAVLDFEVVGRNMVAVYAHLKYGQRSPWFWWSYACGPFCAPQACSESVQVEIVVPLIEIFVSPTSIITLDHKKLLKNSTFVGNT